MVANVPRQRKFSAFLDEMRIITILLPNMYHNGHSSRFFLIKNDWKVELEILEVRPLDGKTKYVCRSPVEPEIGKIYRIADQYGEETDLQIGAVIRTPEFDRKFYYPGPLGMAYSPERTVFRVWAPTATNVKLNLYNRDLTKAASMEMTRKDRGVWELAVSGDLEYYFYTFSVCVNFCWREAVDPYAVAVSANGTHGAIVDLKKTDIGRVALPPLEHDVDAIIYETHIRDFTIHPNSGVKQKGTYSGAAEWNTKTGCGASTCLSYVKELGVTHVEFLPWHDFAGVDELGDKQEYNWGYNPLHFNAPEGSYSLDPENPYARIIELKKMINRFHEAGLGVIMDVVYNHVYIREQSSFEKIVPGYFFRHDENGLPSNGTGVGNDFASERLMARKFILDSVQFWKEEYDVDGFRFDLMGILDIETMNSVRALLDNYESRTLLIGEGWDLPTPLPPSQKANMRNQEKLPRIGQFNDFFRDTIKGSTFDLYDRGYVLGNNRLRGAVKLALAGSIGPDDGKGLFLAPGQSVNYVESHDNHTFWDKMKVCLREEEPEVRKKRQRLATVMVLLAQGIPFLHSGQEFFRTKQGIGNSYRSPDEINRLDWNEMVRNFHHVRYIKGIIAIRKSHRAFRFPKAELIRKHMRFLETDEPVLAYVLEDVGRYGDWGRFIVCFNPAAQERQIELPDQEWAVLADEKEARPDPVRIHRGKKLVLKPFSSYVLAAR